MNMLGGIRLMRWRGGLSICGIRRHKIGPVRIELRAEAREGLGADGPQQTAADGAGDVRGASWAFGQSRRRPLSADSTHWTSLSRGTVGCGFRRAPCAGCRIGPALAGRARQAGQERVRSARLRIRRGLAVRLARTVKGDRWLPPQGQARLPTFWCRAPAYPRAGKSFSRRDFNTYE